MKKITFSTVNSRRHKGAGGYTGFIEKILNGKKTSTIRERSTHEVGDVLQAFHWEGSPYKSKHVNFAKIIITKKTKIAIAPSDMRVCFFFQNETKELSRSEIQALVDKEGFDSVQDFFDWFYYGMMADIFNGYQYDFELIEPSFVVEYGTLAGDICHREVNGFPCEGIIEEPEGSCSCHINPPCAKCMEPLKCSQCDWNSNLA